ncbi:hypothetical protein D9M73_211390 [compost metagenome]
MWVGGMLAAPGPDAEQIAELRRDLEDAGLPADEIEQLLQEHYEPAPVEVMRVNVPVVQWFAEIITLLRWTWLPNGHSHCQGLDWTQVDAERRLTRRRVSGEHARSLHHLANAYAQGVNRTPAHE